ncbi:MAG: hypothetical protein INR73_01970 [Williamsia sp.]|nr:hypothetical protein [Williamsia sp.]
MKQTIKQVIRLAMMIPLLVQVARGQVSKQAATEAINQMAGYIANTMLDEQGKSRCDYNLTEGSWYPYEVPWHTGQAVYALLAAYKQTGNARWLAAAKKAGDFWISLQIKDHPRLKGMLGAVHGDDIGDSTIVFATISDGSPGPYELSRVTGDPKWARVATAAAQWMLNNLYDSAKGICYDNVDLVSGEVQKEHSPFWKDKKDQTLYDISRPNTEGWIFLDAYQFSQKKEFLNAHLTLSNSVVKLEDPNGLWMQFMPNTASEHSFHPRFNLWYAESLLQTWKFNGNKQYLEAALRTARTYAKAQQKDGTIFYVNYTDGRSPDRSSVTGSAVAMAGIVWIQLAKAGYSEFLPYIEKSADWIIRNRYSETHPDKNLRGAILETRMRNRNGKIWLVNRDIGTSFAVRFLVDYLNFKQTNK